ncbi:unnamed protein product [Pleuronectes platessa]|uniref:Uncharacterized protein n=1 Tax=Pleuronectes platessa TaxID=8262 RepID=A0A9N7Z4G6_PLEPL|nr:unnamed protein product [Pleuronectes platessa]
MRAQQTAQGQQEEELVQEVATRWNSALEVIKRIERNKGRIAATAKDNISMLIAPELAKLENLEKLLEPCMGDCPLNWWTERQHTREKLAGIAKKHLCRLTALRRVHTGRGSDAEARRRRSANPLAPIHSHVKPQR